VADASKLDALTSTPVPLVVIAPLPAFRVTVLAVSVPPVKLICATRA